MNNNYKELNIQKSLYRGCGESFAERLEKMDPTENYRGTELGHLDAFQRQLKRFDIQVGGSHSSMLEKFFQNGQSAVLFPEYHRGRPHPHFRHRLPGSDHQRRPGGRCDQ